jgi:uncharacterized protein
LTRAPLVAYLNRNDPDHVPCVALFDARADDLVITPYVLTEACYLVAKYIGADAEANLVEAVAAEDLHQAEITPADLRRIVELMHRYRGFPLGLADASVVAVAERFRLDEVATLDRRHFLAVTPTHIDSFTLLP